MSPVISKSEPDILALHAAGGSGHSGAFLNYVKRHHPNFWSRIGMRRFNMSKDAARTDTFPCVADKYKLLLLWSRDSLGLTNPVLLQRLMELEARASTKGVPFINPPSASDSTSRTEQCRIWYEYSLPGAVVQVCPRTLEGFKHFGDTYGWPFIIKRNWGHGGGDHVQLISCIEDVNLESMVTDRVCIQYVETKGQDGLYRKYRAVVVGNQVIPAHVQISKTWMVNSGSQDVPSQLLSQETKEYVDDDMLPHLRYNLKLAVHTLGLTIGAVDYSFDAKHGLVLWEVTPCFSLADTIKRYGSAVSNRVCEAIYRHYKTTLGEEFKDFELKRKWPLDHPFLLRS